MPLASLTFNKVGDKFKANDIVFCNDALTYLGLDTDTTQFKFNFYEQPLDGWIEIRRIEGNLIDLLYYNNVTIQHDQVVLVSTNSEPNVFVDDAFLSYIDGYNPIFVKAQTLTLETEVL